MSSTDIDLVFEGPAVKDGTIDARLLGLSLAAYSDAFHRANFLANGDVSHAMVQVNSEFRKSSFDVGLKLIQELVADAKTLITSHPFLSATELAIALGLAWNKDSLISLLKWLRGKKPDKIAKSNNETFDFIVAGQKKTVNKTVNVFYGDSAIREALGRAIGPLREGGIDRILLKQEGSEPTIFEKQETAYFETEPIQLEADESPLEGTRDTILVISKLSFTEGTTWTFFERGASLVAKIDDDHFWADIHQRKVKFAEGDRLRVRLSWKIVEKRSKLRPENTIIKVHEHLPRVPSRESLKNSAMHRGSV